MSRSPRVSVVLTAFNAELFIADTLDSVLAQTLEDWELIAVDDGSTDGTADVLRAYGERDARIRPESLPHAGHAAAANAGIARAEGAFIARIDHDDLAVPERLATQVACLENSGLAGCGSQVETFGESSEVWWFPESHEGIARELLFRPGLMQPAAMVRSEVLKANPYVEGIVFDDYELWTRLVPGHAFCNIPAVLTRYRLHSRQTHQVERTRMASDFRRYRFRYFFQMYPGTPLPDYLALARISDRLPFRNRTELDRAERWLSELAESPDPRLRERMEKRWREALQRQALADQTPNF